MDPKFIKLLMDVIEKGDLPADDGDFEKLFDGLDEPGKETLKAIGKLYAAQKDSEAFKAALGKMLGMPGAGDPAQAQKDADGDDDGDDGEGDDVEMKKHIEKAIADQAQKTEAVIKSQQEVIKSLQESIQKANDATRKQEWVTKAQSDLQFVPSKSTDELAQMLFDLEKVDPKMAETQFAVFKALSTQMQTITKTRGFSGETPYRGGAQNDAFQEIIKAATGQAQLEAATTVVKRLNAVQVMKADQITKAAEYEAVTAYLMAHPEAYDAYLAEHPHQTTQGPARH